MARFLTAEWLDDLASQGADSPFDGVSARVEFVVAGGPDGDVKCEVVLDDGRITGAKVGAASGADLTMTLDYATAVEIQNATLDPSVAFMQGRSKAAGNTGVLLELLSRTRTDAYRAWRDKLNATTEF